MRRWQIGGAEVAGRRIGAHIDRVRQRSGRCRLGVPGGRTPGPVFDWLAEHVEPDGVLVTLVDERHVPEDHEDSNLALVRARLPGWTVVPMADGRDSLASARIGYARVFEERFEGGLDIVLLGVGEDGHIASLFPGHPGLEDPAAVVAVHDSPKPPAERLTLGMRVLEDVRLAVVVARGVAKAPVLARAWRRDPSTPLGRYRCAGDALWVLDAGAASRMPAAHSDETA